MCVEFYLILKVAGAKQSLWKMIIYSVIMLITGYFGEVVYTDMAASGICWCCLFCNRLRNLVGFSFKISCSAGGEVEHTKILCWFVLVGWAIYPLGYMMGTTGWYLRSSW
jgi:hypothetical protein